MVQLMNSGNFRMEAAANYRAPVKREIDDLMDHQLGNVNKRHRMSPVMQQWNVVENVQPMPSAHYNPLDEPSPLGLKLRKSPSLLELIQMQLANEKTVKPSASGESITTGRKSSASGTDKLKASNFPASLLKIGNWEYQSKHEGDLVAKCYFAKQKLVWEVLDAGLKSKIEIQWTDIVGLKADCPESGHSSLTVVLGRQPLFFRETNPQPRKHTLWQATFDFTNGEASLNRLHFLQCPQGTLHKHFEKLIQCDMRLNNLSRQPEMVLDSPYFVSSHGSVFDELDPKHLGFNPVKGGEPSLGSVFSDATFPMMPSAVKSSFFRMEQQGIGGRITEQHLQDSLSINSEMTARSSEGFMSQTDGFQGVGSLGQYKEPAGLRPSMSKLDLMNYLDNMIAPVADPSSAEAAERKSQLEYLAEILLNDIDSNLQPPTDETSVMARVNSLLSLLPKDQVDGSNNLMENQHGVFQNATTLGTNNNQSNPHDLFFNPTTAQGEGHSASSMMRRDSYSDLLLKLPRIASLPKFLNNISEDDENRFNN